RSIEARSFIPVLGQVGCTVATSQLAGGRPESTRNAQFYLLALAEETWGVGAVVDTETEMMMLMM
ncbi:hypothetical protein FQN53_007118, partial [Emmonsiellopsis sp. PD_33]